MSFPNMRFLLSFDSANKFAIAVTSRHWGTVTSNVSAARWHFDCWLSLKLVKAFFQLPNSVRKNASSLFYSWSSFCRCFLRMKYVTLPLTSLESNLVYPTNHCIWHERFCFAKAVFGNTNVLSGWFVFSLTISVSVLLEDFLGTSTKVVVSIGLVSFATFELVLTGLKKFLIPVLAFSSTGVFTTITSVSERVNFLEI